MTREEFIALASAHYDQIVDLDKKETFYEYEEGFVDVWTKFGNELLQARIGRTTKDSRKKTSAKPASDE